MSVLLLVPGLVSLFLVLRRRIDTALLSVYLPCLLLLPEAYTFRIPHLPPFSAADYALIPLACIGLSQLIRGGSFALMDLLVALFTASVSLSEILHAPILNDGIFSAINAFVSMVLPYAVGRRLIEPKLRFVTVRRFVILVLLNSFPCLYEWKMGRSLYGMFGERFLGISFQYGGGLQVRGGSGRIGGAFLDAEIAGIGFAMTFCLNAWLGYLRKVKAPVSLGKTLAILEKYQVPALLLLLLVWLTRSRGPLIGWAVGFLILQVLQIARFKNFKLRTFMVAALLVGGYVTMSAYFRSYTNVANRTMTDEQSTAIYRRRMNELYTPIVAAGGWTGWSTLGIPVVHGMKSIDNQYLLVHLAWGRLGYICFLLIVWENIRVLVMRSWQSKAMQDRAFVVSMLAAMATLWFTILTVFLGAQLPQISFLLIGWIQSIVPGKAVTSSAAQIIRNRKSSFFLPSVPLVGAEDGGAGPVG